MGPCQPQPSGHPSTLPPPAHQSAEELADENRRIRRLHWMVTLVLNTIAQDRTLTIESASQMVADTRRAALAMFPDKELAFHLIYWPRLQRLMRERYRIQ